MASSAISHYLSAKIYFKNKTDYSENVFLLTSANIENATNYDDLGVFTPIYPIIKSVSPITYEVSDFLPRPQNIILTINNLFHSMHYTRRFIDILEKYTLIKQKIEIYYTSLKVDEQVSFPDLFNTSNRIFAGTIENIPSDLNASTIQLNCQSIEFIKNIFPIEITPTDFPSAPLKSLGKFVPIVLGDDNVYPSSVIDANYQTGTVNSTSTVQSTALFTTGINLNNFPLGTINKLVVKKNNTVYELDPRGIVDGAFCDSQLAYSSGSFSLFFNNIFKENESIVPYDNINNWGVNGILTKLVFYFYGDETYSGALNGDIIFRFSGQETRVKKSDYPNLKVNASIVQVTINLKEPIILRTTDELLMTVTHTDSNASNNIKNAYAWASSPGSFICPRVDAFFAVAKRFNSSLVNGKSVCAINIGAKNGDFAEYLSNLELSIRSEGLKDTIGTLTGVANSVIKNPVHQVVLLSSPFDGTNWDYTKTPIDLSIFTNSINNNNYLRYTSYYSDGRNFAEEIIQEIIFSAFLKLAPINPVGAIGTLKTMTCYSYGLPENNPTRINEDDIKSISYEVKDSKTIVNKISLFYKPNYTNIDATAITNTVNKNFLGVINLSNSQSLSIYGEKLLEKNQYELLNDSVSATNVARLILSYYSNPLEFYAFEVPYYKYKNLKCCDIIEVSTPFLPNFSGSDMNPDLSFYNGEESSEVAGYEVFASTKKMQIESIITTLLTDDFPKLRIIARVKTSDGDLI